MSTPRAQYFYRFRLQGQLGSVCVDGPFIVGGREKASCTVALDGYSYMAAARDLNWYDRERDEHYAERDSSELDKHLVGESTDPGSHLTNMAKAGVESVARMLDPAARMRAEELKRFPIAVAVQVQADGLRPGEYYPRVWRPSSGFFEDLDDAIDARADARIAGRRLESLLDEIFTVLQPADQAKNHHAYGHRTRELLLLACAEVENSWRAILVASHYSGARFSTKDYVKILRPLRLGEWSLRLADYPSTPALEAFASWTPTNPTTSLPWYDAYNKAKHDRVGGFYVATLWNAVQAVAAAWIMYGAQFGPQWLHAESRLFGVLRYPFAEDTAAGYVTPQPQQPTYFKQKDLALP